MSIVRIMQLAADRAYDKELGLSKNSSPTDKALYWFGYMRWVYETKIDAPHMEIPTERPATNMWKHVSVRRKHFLDAMDAVDDAFDKDFRPPNVPGFPAIWARVRRQWKEDPEFNPSKSEYGITHYEREDYEHMIREGYRCAAYNCEW